MVLQTKSILLKPSQDDGLRICVMRKIKPNYKFDMWWPILAPSLKLLGDYISQKIDWVEYAPKYIKEMKDHKDIVKLLAETANKINITILCYEEIPEKCHRRLLAEECKKYESNLEIIIR